MSLKIDYTFYELSQKAALNRMDLSSVREGVLLRLDEGRGGYAGLQCWPELGDPSLPECLESLRTGEPLPMVQRSLETAACFHGTTQAMTVQSHATLPKLTGTGVTEAIAAGFTTVKVKRGKDWMRMRKKTAAMMEAFPELRWRFDFNGALESPRELHQFLGSIPAEKVDFIEDPFSDLPSAENWRGVPIGHDRILPARLTLEQNYLIAKPALQSLPQVRELAGEHPARVIFTTYMDHPLGQWLAYRAAQNFYAEAAVSTPPLCGLVTHGLYTETAYHRGFGAPAPVLVQPSAQSLAALLQQESWKPLHT